jgi:hypothetical protein
MHMTPGRKGAIAEAVIAAEITRLGGDVDGIAASCEPLKTAYWLPIEVFECRARVHLRLRPARNGQRHGLKCAAQYPLGAIAQLGERRAGSAKVVGSSPTSSIE